MIIFLVEENKSGCLLWKHSMCRSFGRQPGSTDFRTDNWSHMEFIIGWYLSRCKASCCQGPQLLLGTKANWFFP